MSCCASGSQQMCLAHLDVTQPTVLIGSCDVSEMRPLYEETRGTSFTPSTAYTSATIKACLENDTHLITHFVDVVEAVDEAEGKCKEDQECEDFPSVGGACERCPWVLRWCSEEGTGPVEERDVEGL